MINNILIFLRGNINNAIVFFQQYKIIGLAILGILGLVISSFSFNENITIKRKKHIWHIKTSKGLVDFIEKNSLLTEKRNILARDIAFISQKNRVTNINIANTLIYVFVTFMSVSTVFCLIFMKYYILKFVVPILIMIIILFLFSFELNRRRQKAKRDFGRVVKIFTTKYAKSRNTILAFQESIEDIPDSHKYEFNRLISSMSTATDYIVALNEYAERIDDLMCYLFVEILKIGFKRNDYVLLALIDLENDIAVEKKAEKIKNNKLGDKKMNIYLGIAGIFGAYAIVLKFIGSYARNFYFVTFEGQLFMVVSIVIVSIILVCISVFSKLL